MSSIAGLFGGAASDAASAVFSALASWLASGAIDLTTHVLKLITQPTVITGAAKGSSGVANRLGLSPALAVGWFTKQESLMLKLMGLVMLPLLFVSTVSSVLHQDLHRLAKTWLVAVPLALICGFVGVELTTLGLRVTDALSSMALSDLQPTTTIALSVDGMTNPPTGPVVTGTIAFLALLAAVLLWLELIVRSAAVYIAVFFLPLAMSGLVWPTTTRMAKRLVEIVVALILSKFVVAAVIGLGAAAVIHGGADGAVTGVAILLIAGFAPFLLFRMVPIIEAAAIGHLEGAARRPYHGANRMAQNATGVAAGPIGAAIRMGSNGSQGDSSIDAATVASQPLPEQPGEYQPAGTGGTGGSEESAGPGPSGTPSAAHGGDPFDGGHSGGGHGGGVHSGGVPVAGTPDAGTPVRGDPFDGGHSGGDPLGNARGGGEPVAGTSDKGGGGTWGSSDAGAPVGAVASALADERDL